MELYSVIKEPIIDNLKCFNKIFDETLLSTNHYLSQIFVSMNKKGKQMRPILLFLTAKAFGTINQNTYLSAVTLEMLHTASLIHDDVVDESDKRRGIPSVNAMQGNKVAVLVGDYILSTAMLKACSTNMAIVHRIAELGRQLSQGEIIQLRNSSAERVSEESYLEAIRLKTAALFSMSGELGALSVDATDDVVAKMRLLGEIIGICFQIRDDIFDYFNDNVGKPTGNDLAEGKLTLPLIYALSQYPDDKMKALTTKVKTFTITTEERAALVEYAKEKGGIEYAQKVMFDYAHRAKEMVKEIKQSEIKRALINYIDFVTNRTT